MIVSIKREYPQLDWLYIGQRSAVTCQSECSRKSIVRLL